ncbi:MAG: arginine repressor [Clostridiales bacterium]|nr:arginine repressor [Clostridiales bacterium]
MKIARHSKIIELINKYDIVTQEELAEKLNSEGFNVTQATVSRDIRELKLTKIAVDNGKQKYIVIQSAEGWVSEKYIRVLRDGFLSIDRAESLVIIKTVSGMAMAVAATIDGMQWGEIMGCIAGDDTIFCAVRTKEEAFSVIDKIKKMVSNQ